MTRRIAIAILLAVWTTLISGGVVVYMAARSILLSELDSSLIARAATLPEVGGSGSIQGRPSEDQYIIVNSSTHRTIGRPTTQAAAPVRLKVLSAAFSTLGDGHPVRSLTLTVDRPAEAGKESPPMIIYRGSAERFDRTLNRLTSSLAIFGLLAGLCGAAAAAWVSRAALSPLHRAAHIIGEIDEQQLDRRIDVRSLPSELAPVGARMNQMLARLEHAFALRKQFLADASHELRTPVAALVTSLEITLNRPRRQEELMETLQTCLSEAKVLKKLVVNLMEQAHSETPAGNESVQEIALHDLIRECVVIGKTLGIKRGVELSWSVPGDMPIHTQPGRLRSVVMNLIANAVEYTRPGGMVRISAKRDTSQVTLEVQDQGPGIEPENIPRIFEPFYRISPDRNSVGEHLGLGLFLVQSHLRAIGGKCRVESQMGTGSRFIVDLPIEPAGKETRKK